MQDSHLVGNSRENSVGFCAFFKNVLNHVCCSVESSSKTEQNSLLKLYGVHVKNELLARKTEKKNEFLRAEVQQCKNQVLVWGLFQVFWFL